MRALVTGASAGLGRAFTQRLIGEGWDVVGIDRSAAPALGARHATLFTDLGDPAALDRCVEAATLRGPFDLVVLNAGISATGRFETIPLAVHLNVLTVDAEAPLVLVQGLLAADAIADGARLLFVSSLSHFSGYPGAASYAAGKDALAVYAASLRRALRRMPVHRGRRITVTTAFPGPLRTDHAARHAPPGSKAGRRMTPQDAAAAILAATFAGRARVVPGFANKAGAAMGRLAPAAMARLMRRVLYERLDRDVY